MEKAYWQCCDIYRIPVFPDLKQSLENTLKAFLVEFFFK